MGKYSSLAESQDPWPGFTADSSLYVDQHGHRTQWKLNRSQYKDGIDDITAVNILRPSQRPADDSENLIVGRASGILENISVSRSNFHVTCHFETHGRGVRAATVSLVPEPLLAACLADNAVALYPIQPISTEKHSNKQVPLGDIKPSQNKSVRTWSTSFLRSDRLAVGLGQTPEPIVIYNIRPEGFDPSPLIRLRLETAYAENSQPTSALNEDSRNTSPIYPIVPLPHSSGAGGVQGDLFLSGGYDGSVRLHDLRSPQQPAAVFTDPVDVGSAIYSLLPIGRENFLAGGARHSIIKIFDLRMPGERKYHAADLDSMASGGDEQQDFNLFVLSSSDGRYQRSKESPIYSLSSPSPCSPSLFVGTENNVAQVDMVSTLDQYQDPIYENSSPGNNNADIKWDPHLSALQLAMSDHTTGNVKLRNQAPVYDWPRTGRFFDERWKTEEA